jgi:hypothetical protein
VPAVTHPDGTVQDELLPEPDGPLAAEVVRTAVDSYVGRVSLVRVFSGTLRPERQVHVSGHGLAERGHFDHDVDERVAHLYSPLGADLREVPYCVAGDLCALTKVGSAETGDTVSAPDHPLLMATWLQAGDGQPWLLILPASVFLVDTALTLAGRMLRRERWWEPHVQHAYQSWARGIDRHGPVTLAYAMATGGAVAAMLMGFCG